mmetsp:Transcript_40821/g.46805  ORF Transcript_40821/g.46805 Transcript_40821/m.46805 type:complete len:81 (+) Transcript_40821:19-261(+)
MTDIFSDTYFTAAKRNRNIHRPTEVQKKKDIKYINYINFDSETPKSQAKDRKLSSATLSNANRRMDIEIANSNASKLLKK